MEPKRKYDKFGLLLRPGGPAWGRLPTAADINSMGADLDAMLTRPSFEGGTSTLKRGRETEIGDAELTQTESIPNTTDVSEDSEEEQRRGRKKNKKNIQDDKIPTTRYDHQTRSILPGAAAHKTTTAPVTSAPLETIASSEMTLNSQHPQTNLSSRSLLRSREAQDKSHDDHGNLRMERPMIQRTESDSSDTVG